MTSTSCRSSFEEEEEEEGHAKANNTSPPRKIRRSAAAAAASESFPGSTAMRSVRSYSSRAPYFATTPLGFAANEFLPLKGSDLNMQSRKNLQQIEANKLSDDALGMCLFTGFLNSFEMVRLRSVNKRICRIASKQVHKLDLRKCENLTPVDIQNIVSSFHNLTDMDFSYCSTFGAEELHQLIPIGKNLINLGLKGTRVGDEALVQFLQEVYRSNGPIQLQSIDVSAINKEYSRLRGDATASALSTFCPNLKSLKMGWCSRLTDHGVQCLVELSNLVELDISLTSITSKSCDFLCRMGHQIQALDLSATQISSEGIKNLFNRPSIFRKLAIRFLDDFDSELLELIIQRAPELDLLDITHSGPGQRIRIQKNLLLRLQQRGFQIQGNVSVGDCQNR